MNMKEDILFAVCAASNMSYYELVAYNRQYDVAEYRHVWCFLLRHYNPDCLTADIIKHVKRDWATIKNSIEVINNCLNRDKSITEKYYKTIKILRPMTIDEQIADLKNQQRILKDKLVDIDDYMSDTFKEAQSKLITVSNELEIAEKKKIAFKKVEDEYNDPQSPHYRDNLRYKWAVDTINAK